MFQFRFRFEEFLRFSFCFWLSFLRAKAATAFSVF